MAIAEDQLVPAQAAMAKSSLSKSDKNKPLILCTNSEWNNELVNKEAFQLIVICCKNYDHRSKYVLPVRPSPNLPTIQSIYLYPTTCLFEGTVLSEGRGTNKPFQLIGHPALPKNMVQFTPNPNEGAKKSKHYGFQFQVLERKIKNFSKLLNYIVLRLKFSSTRTQSSTMNQIH